MPFSVDNRNPANNLQTAFSDIKTPAFCLRSALSYMNLNVSMCITQVCSGPLVSTSEAALLIAKFDFSIAYFGSDDEDDDDDDDDESRTLAS